MSFLADHLAEIYVVYGFSFLLLGFVVLLQPKEDRALHFAPYLWLIGLFGLLHGFKELFDWWQLAYQPRHPAIVWLSNGLLLISYLPLFEFGRRIGRQFRSNDTRILLQHPLPPALYAGAGLGLILLTLLASQLSSGLDAAIRLFIGLPGALLTGLGLLGYARVHHHSLSQMRAGWTLQLTAYGFIAYGLLTALIASDPRIGVVLPTQALFLEVTGTPVQLWRALAAIVIALGLGLLLRSLNNDSRQRENETTRRYLELNSQLEQRIHSRTRQLQEVNDQLNEVIEEHRVTEQALRKSERDLNRAQAIAQIGSWTLDVKQNLLEWSPETYRIFGIPKGKTLTYEMFLDAVHPEDQEMVNRNWQAALAGAGYEVEHRIIIHDRIKWVRENAELEFDDQGELTYGIGTVQDISARVEAQLALEQVLEELRQSEKTQRELRLIAEREQGRMAALLSAMSIGILFEDRDRVVEYVNPAFRTMWAIPEHEVLEDRETITVLEQSTHRFARPDHASKYVLQVLDTHEISERFELDLYDGRVLTQISYPVLDNDERVLGRLWIYEDITNERQTAQQLLYLAQRDPLTGLYNRHRFQEQLEQSIINAQRNNARFALFYFDLDEFKYINDTFGHSAGDSVLIRIANEVQALVRGGETLARLGGDEFALLTALQQNNEISALASRIVSAVSSLPFRFRGRHLRMTTSLGVAVFPDHGLDTEDLVARADAAMYQAKSQGKNTWAIYDADRDTSQAMVERLSWNQRIVQAMEKDLLELHYQGIYHTTNSSISHLEALVRMRDPLNPEQLYMPGQFIPIAEKSGTIVDLDRWVIKRVVRTLSELPHLPAIAVNVSGRTFDDPALPQYIRSLLREYELDPQRLIIELTETAAVTDMQDAQAFIEAMHRAGCRVALDDFGSGFSTFTYLKHLGVEILKIDGQFISDLPNNAENQAFVKAMVGVARGLHKICIAEFVEDAATLEMIRDIGVDLAQGYYLDRPDPNHPALTKTTDKK